MPLGTTTIDKRNLAGTGVGEAVAVDKANRVGRGVGSSGVRMVGGVAEGKVVAVETAVAALTSGSGALSRPQAMDTSRINAIKLAVQRAGFKSVNSVGTLIEQNSSG